MKKKFFFVYFHLYLYGSLWWMDGRVFFYHLSNLTVCLIAIIQTSCFNLQLSLALGNKIRICLLKTDKCIKLFLFVCLHTRKYVRGVVRNIVFDTG